MRFMVVSNVEGAAQVLHDARTSGCVCFIFEHADPEHRLHDNKFLYVRSDEELMEKAALVRADPSVILEARL